MESAVPLSSPDNPLHTMWKLNALEDPNSLDGKRARLENLENEEWRLKRRISEIQQEIKQLRRSIRIHDASKDRENQSNDNVVSSEPKYSWEVEMDQSREKTDKGIEEIKRIYNNTDIRIYSLLHKNFPENEVFDNFMMALPRLECSTGRDFVLTLVYESDGVIIEEIYDLPEQGVNTPDVLRELGRLQGLKPHDFLYQKMVGKPLKPIGISNRTVRGLDGDKISANDTLRWNFLSGYKRRKAEKQ